MRLQRMTLPPAVLGFISMAFDRKEDGMTEKKQRLQTLSALLILVLLLGSLFSFFIKPIVEDAQMRKMLGDEDAYVTDSLRDPWIYVTEDGMLRLYPEYMVGMETVILPDAVNGVALTGMDLGHPISPLAKVRTLVFPKRFSMHAEDEYQVLWMGKWENLEVLAFAEGATDLTGIAVYEMPALKAVYLPKSMTGMHPWTFLDCGKDLTVYYAGTEEEFLTLGTFAQAVKRKCPVVFNTPVPDFGTK